MGRRILTSGMPWLSFAWLLFSLPFAFVFFFSFSSSTWIPIQSWSAFRVVPAGRCWSKGRHGRVTGNVEINVGGRCMGCFDSCDANPARPILARGSMVEVEAGICAVCCVPYLPDRVHGTDLPCVVAGGTWFLLYMYVR